MLIATVALAALFFTGEEISWGQSYFGWETPEGYRELAGNEETNLHNNDWISLQSLGSAFLLGVFVVLPIAWHFGGRRRLPADWGPAIADGPVVFTFVFAFAWSKCKELYALLRVGEGDPMLDPFYAGFVEQLGEQKELIIAAGLLLYGLSRLRLSQQLAARSVDESSDRAA